MTEIVPLGQPTVGRGARRRSPRCSPRAGSPVPGRLPGLRGAVRRGRGHAARARRRPTAAPRCTSASTCSAPEPGDEVIVGDYTFPATGHSVDVDGRARRSSPTSVPTSGALDPAAVEAAITPRTVGIIAVDVFGQPADYDELRAIADQHGLWLMEDAACSAGATYKGRPAGSLADVATFSFHGRKGITAGEGGALTTDRDDLAEHARKLHTYGIEPALSREGSADLPVPVVRRGRLQLPALRRRRRHHARPARPAARPPRPPGDVAAALRASCSATSTW